MTGPQAEWPRNHSLIPWRYKFFSSPKHPEWLWGLHCLLFSRCQGLFFQGWSGWGVKLYLHSPICLHVTHRQLYFCLYTFLLTSVTVQVPRPYKSSSTCKSEKIVYKRIWLENEVNRSVCKLFLYLSITLTTLCVYVACYILIQFHCLFQFNAAGGWGRLICATDILVNAFTFLSCAGETMP